jgi:hypothetical protein
MKCVDCGKDACYLLGLGSGIFGTHTLQVGSCREHFVKVSKNLIAISE